MNDINKLLLNANVYSIEFSGFIALKLSISADSPIFKVCDDVTLEFNTGAILIDQNGNQVELTQNVLKLFGSTIEYCSIMNNDIELKLDNEFTILSENLYSNNELIDRYWVIKETLNGDYLIFNDTNEIVFSNLIQELL